MRPSIPIRVLVADDHVPTRRGVRASLEDAGMVVVAEAANGESAVAAAVEHRPDVALLDVHMPGIGGVRAAAEILRRAPQIAVVMLTYSRDDEDLFAALRVGAVGFLTKDIDPVRLPAALRGVLAGEAAVPRDLVARVLRAFRSLGRQPTASGADPLARLSSRELEVMELLADGLSTDEVATRLHLSPNTVRVHVSSAVKKLRVSGRDEAIRVIRGGG